MIYVDVLLQTKYSYLKFKGIIFGATLLRHHCNELFEIKAIDRLQFGFIGHAMELLVIIFVKYSGDE